VTYRHLRHAADLTKQATYAVLFNFSEMLMKITFKKNQSTVSVKVGTAWPFWFAFAFPAIALLSFLRRRLYLQALLVIAYIAAQTYGECLCKYVIANGKLPHR